MKIEYYGKVFDSELELNYYNELKEKGIDFKYQSQYKSKPIKINLGRRKTYTPDFVIKDHENKVITIVETKGYARWSANEDNNIMDFMKTKVIYDKEFLILWLIEIDYWEPGYQVDYKRLKYLKSFGFVDYDFKNPNTLSNQRRVKIQELEEKLKNISNELKNCKRYITLSSKTNLTAVQKRWMEDFKKELEE